MRNKVFFAVVIFWFTNSYSQDSLVNYTNYTHSFGIQITSGITTFELDKSKAAFEDFLQKYIDAGVPLESQKIYPANILWGGHIYYFPNRELSFTLGMEFTNTSAYSLYGDYAGTIDIKSKIELLSIDFAVKKHLMDLLLQPYAGLQIGITSGTYMFERKTQYIDFPQYSSSDKIEYSKIGYCMEGSVGVSYDLEYFIIDLQGGYRYSIIPKPENEDLNVYYGENEFDELETSGIAFKLSLRSGIYW